MSDEFSRINDPVAYGDIDESDETLIGRAIHNLEIDGFDSKYLDIEVESSEEYGDKVAYLFTLLRAPVEGRVRIDGDPVRPSSVETGDRKYFDHIWDTRAVEGEHVRGDND